MRRDVRTLAGMAGGLLALALALAVAAPAGAATVTTTNACLYSVNG